MSYGLYLQVPDKHAWTTSLRAVSKGLPELSQAAGASAQRPKPERLPRLDRAHGAIEGSGK